jgi:hypothetical protein
MSCCSAAASSTGDTVIGFGQLNRDLIQLTTDPPSNALAHLTLVNDGQDTQIALTDGSAIVLRGVTSIDNSFLHKAWLRLDLSNWTADS